MKTPMIHQMQLPTMAHKTVWHQGIGFRSSPICSGNIKARSLGIVHDISSYLIQCHIIPYRNDKVVQAYDKIVTRLQQGCVK